MQTILTILAGGFALSMIVSVLVVLTSARAAAVGDRMKAQADSLRPTELDQKIAAARFEDGK